MSDSSNRPPIGLPIKLKQYRWLERQVGLWINTGVIEPSQGQAILNRYEDPMTIQTRQGRWAFMAVMAAALILIGISLSLVISFNWDQIPRAGKVAGIFGLVMLCFAGASVSYQYQRLIAGELLAMAGVLSYGLAIWLLAQVFHIESHYPDGMMWWAIGATITALLLGSRNIGMLAVVLLGAWVTMEAAGFNQECYFFLLPTFLLLGLAYALNSYWLLGLVALSVLYWMLITTVGNNQTILSIYGMVVLGGLYYIVGLLHDSETVRGRIWMVLGILTILVALIPLTFLDYHRYQSIEVTTGAMVTMGVLGLLTILATGLVILLDDWRSWVAFWPVHVITITALATGLILAILFWGIDHHYLNYQMLRESPYGYLMAGLYNGLALLLGLFIVYRGVRTDRGLNFAVGIIYILVLALMRWINLIGDMLTSALLFFVAGGILLASAFYWRYRRHASVQQTQGVSHA